MFTNTGSACGALSRDIRRLPTTPLLFSVAQGIFWLSTERLSRSTLHLKEGGGEGSVYSCTLQSCNCDVLRQRLGTDSVKSPKVGLYFYTPSLWPFPTLFHRSIRPSGQGWCQRMRKWPQSQRRKRGSSGAPRAVLSAGSQGRAQSKDLSTVEGPLS